MPATSPGTLTSPLGITTNVLRWLVVPAVAMSLSACGGSGGSSTTYTSPSLTPDTYEQDDSAATAKTITVNATQNRNHFDDGTDWIKFTANGGYQYTITTFNLGAWADTTLTLYDSNQNWLDYNDDYSAGLESQIVWTAPTSGTYYINAGSLFGADSYTSYSIALTAQAPLPQPDLVMETMTLPASVAINDVLTFSDTIKNQGGAPSGGFNVDYYLSTNTIISTADSYLGSRRVTSLAAAATSTASSSFAVPGTLTVGGTYYLGALIDTGNEVTELFESNNTSNAYAITIAAALPAELTISGVSAATASVAAGELLTVSDTVSNSGITAAGVDVYYYLSADATIEPIDVYIGKRSIATVGSVDDVNTGLDISLPRDFIPGNYYLGAIVDPLDTVVEGNEADNVSNAAAVSVTAAIPSDLVFSAFTPDTVVNTFNQMSITDTVWNQGSGNEQGFNVSYYLSSDSIIDPVVDTYLGNRTITSLAGGASDTGTVSFAINQQVGTYYIGAVIDTAAQAIESDITNNASAAMTVSVVNPDLAMGTIGVTPTVVQVGDPITISSVVTNIGSADITNNFDIRYYLSGDPVINTADALIGTRTVAGLAAGATDSANVPSTVPAVGLNGIYYLGAIADPFNNLSDGNTANNTSNVVSMNVTVCTPDAYEEDDAYTSAKLIGVGQAAQSHNFCEDASDWLAFTAISGTSYSIETTVLGTTDTVLKLYGTDGITQLLINDDGGVGLGSLITNWVAPATGTYYINATSFGGDIGYPVQDYTITLRTP